MSLSKQLVFLILGMLLLLFIGTFYSTVQSSRAYLGSRMAASAQEAATSLGLSVTSSMVAEDKAAVSSMVNAMYIKGGLQVIRIDGLAGNDWVVRRTKLELPDVPGWFVSMFPIKTPEGTATIMSGWRQIGTVHVAAHPQIAYQQLWTVARQTMYWFIVGAMLMLVFGLTLIRGLLKPLDGVVAQAESICNKDFVIEDKIPSTLEFKRVVEAMNQLSKRVQEMLGESEKMAAKLHKQAFQDPLTGLANKRQLMDVLTYLTERPSRLENGALLFLQLRGLRHYNQENGYQAGDQLLIETAKIIKSVTGAQFKGLQVHTSGADFAILAQEIGDEKARELAEKLSQALASLYGMLNLPSADVGHVGLVCYSGQSRAEILAETDAALRKAQSTGANSWAEAPRQDQDGEIDKTMGCGATDCKKFIESALSANRIQLQRQPVIARDDRRVMHHEVFIRLIGEGKADQPVSAGRFMPMAETFGLAPRIDKTVIDLVMASMDVMRSEPVAINISPSTLQDGDTLSKTHVLQILEDKLRIRSELGGLLVLEFPEYGATAHLDKLKQWITRLAPYGVRFSLDHFGKGFGSYGYLRSLKAHYLKVDGSLIHHLDEQPDNQLYLQSLVKIAHGLDMQVIAEAVESEVVWEMLDELGIDGGRGYWLGRPV